MRKFTAFALAFSIMISLFVFRANADVISGDVDGDGTVTLKDAAIIARHAGGWVEYTASGGGITYPGAGTAVEEFRAGFGQADITPSDGVPMAGFGSTWRRLSTGTSDSLYATAIAIADSANNLAILISVDNVGISNEIGDPIRTAIAAKLCVDEDAIFLTCTHTHSGPDVNTTVSRVAADVNRYLVDSFLPGLMNAAAAAVADLSEAEVQTASSYSDHINFVRRCAVRYSDGTTGWEGSSASRTDISAYLDYETQVDEEVQIACFVRDGKDDILLYNWQCHACILPSSNTTYSSDFVGAARTKLETDLSGVRAVYYQGAAGNVAHNDRLGHYSTPSTYSYSQTVGQGLASAVETAYAALTPVTGGTALRHSKVTFNAAQNWNQSELEIVIEWNRTHNLNTELTDLQAMTLLYTHASAVNSGYQTEYNKTNAAYLSAVSAARAATGLYLENYHAAAIINRINANCTVSNGEVTAINKTASIEFPIYTVTVGNSVGFVGVPVEMFDSTGQSIKHGHYLDKNGEFFAGEASLFDRTFICAYTNGKLGYMPAEYAYAHTCYEDNITSFAPGVAEEAATLAIQKLNELYYQNPGSARKTVVKEMGNMMNLHWQTDTAFEYNKDTAYSGISGVDDPDLADIDGTGAMNFAANTTYAFLPYTHSSTSRFAFLSYTDYYSKGTYYLTGLERVLFDVDGTSTKYPYSGLEGPSILGNDCADAVAWGWSAVCSSISYPYTARMTPGRGVLPVGTYELTTYDDSVKVKMRDPDGNWRYTYSTGYYTQVGYYPDVDSGLGEFYNTDVICTNNGTTVMYGAYAELQPGDGLVMHKGGHFYNRQDAINAGKESSYNYDGTGREAHALSKSTGLRIKSRGEGHAIMVAEVHVVTNANGSVNGTSSYVLIHQQNSNYNASNKYYETMTFKYLYDTGYLPVTTQELKDADANGGVFTPDEPTAVLSRQVGNTAANSTTDRLFKVGDSAQICLNYRVSSVTVTATDPSGVVQKFTYYPAETAIRPERSTSTSYTRQGASAPLNSPFSVNMANFNKDIGKVKPDGSFGYYHIDDYLTTDVTYHIKVDCQVATGAILTAFEGDLVH